MPDDLAMRKRRILFRANHRGMKETDMLFGRLAREVLDDLDEAGVAAFERLLDVPDQEIIAWISGHGPQPQAARCALGRRLAAMRFDARRPE